MIGNVFKRFLGVLLGLGFFFGLYASVWAEVAVEARLSKSEIALDQVVELKISVSNTKENVSVNTDAMTDFYILSQGSSKSYRIVNNNFSASSVLMYTLRPKRSGKLLIPAFSMFIEGKTYTTEPLELKVLERGQAGASGSATTQTASNRHRQVDVFIEASVDKSSAYVGEITHYRLFLYRSVALLSELRYELPQFGNVEVKQLERDPKVVETVRNGRRYYVQEIDKRALIAYEAGKVKISPAVVQIHMGVYGVQTLNSNSVGLTIKALPTLNKPQNFSGVVGDYHMQTSIDSSAPVQNKPLPVRLKISGTGDLTQIHALTYSEDRHYKVYKSTVKDQITYSDTIKGVRELEYIVVPKDQGKYALPVFEFNFFSPKERRYITLRSSALSISVIASGLSQADISRGEEARIVEEIAQDLRYIRLGIDVHDQKKLFYQSFLGLIFVVGSFLYALVFFVRVLWDQGLSTFVENFRAKKPFIRALDAVGEAEKLDSVEDQVRAIQALLYDYLTVLIGKQARALTGDELEVQLKRLSCLDSDISDLKAVLNHCAYIGYAPASINEQDIYALLQAVKELLQRLKGYES